ncbi:MAG TPA: hypothetical protein GX392_02375 [Clostridiales bacterium]|nr:hypothetical protein [Clostridiales bacterium]
MIEIVGYLLNEAIDILHKHNPNIVLYIKIYTAPYHLCEYNSIDWDKRVIRQKHIGDNIIELTVSYFKKSSVD